jgi:hypothetical protein
MKTLNLLLDLAAIDDATGGSVVEPFVGRTPVIYKVQEANGQLIKEGVATSREPTRIQLGDSDLPEQLFVRVILPNGRSVSHPVDFASRDEVTIRITDEDLAGDDWAKWALTRSSRSQHAPAAISKFRNVWLCLWTRQGNGWARVAGLPRTNTKANDAATQVDLALSGAFPQLLQFGGAHVPWTLVSLPPGRCRVYITSNPLQDSTSLPIKVIVTSFRPEAETLLELLSRDSLKAADAMLKFGPIAERLLHDKYIDAVSAIVGAYVLLRLGRWKNIDVIWFRNLHESFPWSSDAALIRCAVTARHGLSESRLVKQFCKQLEDCLDRGLPMFEEAHPLLLEVQSVGQAILDSEIAAPRGLRDLLDRCKPISASRVSVGSSFAVLGASPVSLSPTRQRGLPLPDDEPMMAAETEPSALEALVFAGSTLESSDPSEPAPRFERSRRVSKRPSNVVRLKDL